MGLGVSLISFSPNTTIKSADVNTNFTNLNNGSNFNGTVSGTFNGQLAADGGQINSDGSGDLTLKKLIMTTGSIARIAQFSGSGSGLFNHNLGATPDMCLIGYAGNFGISTLQPITWWTPNSTQVNVNSTGTFSWVGMAFKFNP